MGQKLKKNKIKIILSIILTIILIIIIRNLLVKKYNEIFVQKYVSKIYPNYTIVEKNYEYLDGFLVNLVWNRKGWFWFRDYMFNFITK